MLTNKEKFLLLVSREKNDTMEQILWRIENRETIREQQKIELEKLEELNKNKK